MHFLLSKFSPAIQFHRQMSPFGITKNRNQSRRLLLQSERALRFQVFDNFEKKKNNKLFEFGT